MDKLKDMVAIVTGASKGIGAAIARHLAAAGARVVVNYASSKEGADRVVADIERSGGTAVPLQADVAKPADVSRLFAETERAFGRLDILVNNAGVYERRILSLVLPHIQPMLAVSPAEPLHRRVDPDSGTVCTPPILMAFDCLWIAESDLRRQPLRRRRRLLEEAVDGSGLIFQIRRLAPNGVEAWKFVPQHGYEGLVEGRGQRVSRG